ncbi:MAG TPA: hypothetical protein PK869_11795 [Candidatus Hydrogenedentes bacterium]|mgnify:CR=1 FL=1|nr:hypothetical protein [Candidatus Hydrogenedentota bacterium]
MIASLPLLVFLVMVAFLIAMSGIMVYAGVYARKRGALVQRMPTSKIAWAEDGYCEIEGEIEAIDGRALTAPLTLAPCCWYHAKVEKWIRGSGNNTQSRWDTVREVTSTEPFLLRDDTGVCVVYPDCAEVTPTDKSLWYGADEEPEERNPRRVPPTESAKGMFELSGTQNTKFRYSEERMYAGDFLLALGMYASKRGDGADDEGEDDASDPEIDSEDDGPLTEEDELISRGQQLAQGTLQVGGKEPFILSTTPQETHIALMKTGGLGAFFVALFPLALVALLFWWRYG